MADERSKAPMDILGQCLGVRLRSPEEAGNRDGTFQILIEDDGHWHAKDVCCSNFWLDDLIEVLLKAKGAVR